MPKPPSLLCTRPTSTAPSSTSPSFSRDVDLTRLPPTATRGANIDPRNAGPSFRGGPGRSTGGGGGMGGGGRGFGYGAPEAIGRLRLHAPDGQVVTISIPTDQGPTHGLGHRLHAAIAVARRPTLLGPGRLPAPGWQKRQLRQP